jgi:hypothetical protein
MDRNTTTITIVGDLVGTFWWPAGVEWTKDVCTTFTRTPDQFTLPDEIGTLREAVAAICNDGDSASAPLLSADSILEIRRTITESNRTRTRSRRYMLREFSSVSDYLVPS